MHEASQERKKRKAAEAEDEGDTMSKTGSQRRRIDDTSRAAVLGVAANVAPSSLSMHEQGAHVAAPPEVCKDDLGTFSSESGNS